MQFKQFNFASQNQVSLLQPSCLRVANLHSQNTTATFASI